MHLGVILLVMLICLAWGWVVGVKVPAYALGANPHFWELFWNNIKVGGLIVFSGLVTMGIGSLLLVGFNMAILGISSGGVYATSGFGPIVTGVLPHAPCEVAAMTLCALLGFEGWRVLAVFKERLVCKESAEMSFIGTFSLAVVAVLLYCAGAVLEAAVSHA